MILPHGLQPGESVGGTRSINNKIEWDKYGWNPPEYLVNISGYEQYWLVDPNASPKPTWEELVNAYSKFLYWDAKQTAINICDFEVTNRIAKLYHSKAHIDRNKEFEVRLSGADTTEADKKRLEYIAICHKFESQIEKAITVKQLEKIIEDIQKEKSWH